MLLLLAIIGFALWLYLVHHREHLEARYFACSQVCDFSHPGLLNTCQQKGGIEKDLAQEAIVSQECKDYYDCVRGCRAEQRKEIAGDPNFNVGSPYAHLSE